MSRTDESRVMQVCDRLIFDTFDSGRKSSAVR